MLDRRQFLTTLGLSAVAGGKISIAASASQRRPTRLTDIDHIFIMMQENRSFDHYFGTLAGVRGFADIQTKIAANGLPIFFQQRLDNPTKYCLPFRLNTRTTSAQRSISCMDHGWNGQHASWNKGANDRFVATNVATMGTVGFWTMGYHTRDDLPFYYALADAFTICDGYHCSVLGPTLPNRVMALSATIDPKGEKGGPEYANNGVQEHPSPNGTAYFNFSWETYPERLDRAGVSWRNYFFMEGGSTLSAWVQYQSAPKSSHLYAHGCVPHTLDGFLNDIRTSNVPQVSWITAPLSMWEHPSLGTPLAGQNLVHQILTALWSNPKLWAKSLFILHYDENDGLFDHVIPPTPDPDTPDEFVLGEPIGLGFRVPCLVVSPFSRGGYVCSDILDHTSTLRLLEGRFGVEVANLSSWRRQTCADFTGTLGLGEPPRFDVPDLPDTEMALADLAFNLPNLPAPTLPSSNEMPMQEPGTKNRRGGA